MLGALRGLIVEWVTGMCGWAANFAGNIGHAESGLGCRTVWPSVLELLGHRLIKHEVRHGLGLSRIEPRGLIQ